MQNLEHFDGIKEDMGKKTTDAKIQSHHYCLVVRVCQKAYVETQQSVQFVPDGHKIGSLQASFCNTSECSNYRSEKKTLKRVDCCGRERSEMLMEDLGRNVTPCLHNSFCRNRETNVDPLPSTSNSVRITTDVLQDTKTESKEAMSQEEEMEQ